MTRLADNDCQTHCLKTRLRKKLFKVNYVTAHKVFFTLNCIILFYYSYCMNIHNCISFKINVNLRYEVNSENGDFIDEDGFGANI